MRFVPSELTPKQARSVAAQMYARKQSSGVDTAGRVFSFLTLLLLPFYVLGTFPQATVASVMVTVLLMVCSTAVRFVSKNSASKILKPVPDDKLIPVIVATAGVPSKDLSRARFESIVLVHGM